VRSLEGVSVSMAQALITNAALLISLSTLYGLLNFIQDRPSVKKILTGILFGGIAIIAMMTPFRLSSGIFYDGRSIILTLAGLFGGGPAALIAAVIAGLYRFSLGGSGVWAGLATIFACSLVGLYFRRLNKNNPEKIDLGVLYLVGVITHVVMLICQLLIPWPQAFEIIAEIWLPILLIFPLATFLIGVFIKNEEDRYQTHNNLQASQSQYRKLLQISQNLTSMRQVQTIQQTIVESAVQIAEMDTGVLYMVKGEGLSLEAATPPLPPQFPDAFRLPKLSDHPHIQQAFANGQPVIMTDTKQADLTEAEQEIVAARDLRTILYLPLLIENRAVGILILGSIGRLHSLSGQEINLTMTLSSQAALSIENARLFEETQRNALELEKRVTNRTRSLQIANEELESFSYSVSHDLRAPLRAINGFTEIINRRHRENLNAEGQHYIENIIEASNRMGVLIDDLLKFSRLGRSGIHHEPVNLNEVMAELAGDLQAFLVENEGTLDIPLHLPTVVGDRTLLSQVFSNLVDNGLKYRTVGTAPRVKISAQEDENVVIIAVEDNGIGIPLEYQGKIFTIFQRLHSTEEYSGIGIGLATVKKALDLMGGSITLESQPGKGSTFYVKLPKERN